MATDHHRDARPHRISIRDVARQAGVSVTTVSRVFNRPETVKGTTRDRVMECAGRLGYVPNANAKGLIHGMTQTIALMVPSITNPAYAEIARSIEELVDRYGMHVFLCNTFDQEERERRYLRALQERRVDGIIYAAARLDSDDLIQALLNGPPSVLVNRYVDGVELDAVVVDNRRGAREATRHLVSDGHVRIGHLRGPDGISTARDRFLGYQDGLHDVGIPYDERLVAQGDFTRWGGYLAAKSLLELSDPPTAIFAQSDEMAIGAMRVVQEHGFQVPKDIAVMGFDNTDLASLEFLQLSTISQQLPRMGQLAFEILMDRIKYGRKQARHVVLEPSLVLRRSCGH